MTIYEGFIDGHDVETAVVETIRNWEGDYIAELVRRTGEDIPRPKTNFGVF